MKKPEEKKTTKASEQTILSARNHDLMTRTSMHFDKPQDLLSARISNQRNNIIPNTAHQKYRKKLNIKFKLQALNDSGALSPDLNEN